MPQELRIVKCFRCITYQVDIVKKDKKWTCKMCGAKQTLKQEFGRGSGIECRKRVQKLNMRKHEFEQMAHDVVQQIVNEEIEVPDFLLEQTRAEDGIPPNTDQCNQPKSSKWETFVEPPDEESDSETLLEKQQLQSSASIKIKRVCKRKTFTPEIDKPQVEQLENQMAPETISTFFNFNKKSKFEFAEGNVSSQNPESKPKIAAIPKPKLNPYSKWGDFLNNSEEEDE